MEKKGEIVNRLVGGVDGLLKANGVKVIEGVGRPLSAGKVEVTGADGAKKIVEGDKVIIAAGSIPAIPPIPGVKENKNCIDSTGALSLKKLPKSLLIIGGGVIGIELGSAYKAFGTEVTIIEALPKLLPMMDGELTAQLRSILEGEGIVIKTESKVMSVEDSEVGAKVNVEADGQTIAYEAEKVLVAVGRRTDTAALRLDDAGIRNDRGRIEVNEKQETSVPGIYAIGDCLGKVMLAHVGQEDMEAGNVRKLIGDDMVLGVSAQTVEQALLAEKRGADYLGVGAMFATATKDDAAAVSFDMNGYEAAGAIRKMDRPDAGTTVIIAMYGHYPSNEVDRRVLDIKPIKQIKASIVKLKDVPRGTSVGYNRKFIAMRDSRIATIEIGYADGLSRSYSEHVSGCFLCNAFAGFSEGNDCQGV